MDPIASQPIPETNTEHLCLHPYIEVRKAQNDRVCLTCGQVLTMPCH
jgi:hypothetical protein